MAGENGGTVVGYGEKKITTFEGVTPTECRELQGKMTPEGCKVLSRKVIKEDEEGNRHEETEFLSYREIS